MQVITSRRKRKKSIGQTKKTGLAKIRPFMLSMRTAWFAVSRHKKCKGHDAYRTGEMGRDREGRKPPTERKQTLS